MKPIMHLKHDGSGDEVSILTPDPGVVDSLGVSLEDDVSTGIACRWIALRDAECPCGAALVQITRRMRRKAKVDPPWSGYIRHEARCPSMYVATRLFIKEHRSAWK